MTHEPLWLQEWLLHCANAWEELAAKSGTKTPSTCNFCRYPLADGVCSECGANPNDT
jgi:hypothetical protein